MFKTYKANNGIVAISVYKVFSNKGYKIPEDIQLIGFDNTKFSKILIPEITTIEQPIKKIGKLVAKIVIGQKNGDIFKK